MRARGSLHGWEEEYTWDWHRGEEEWLESKAGKWDLNANLGPQERICVVITSREVVPR